MKGKKALLGEAIKGSKFKLVLAAAKRSKQLNRMAKDRGLPANQVAFIKTALIKPPTIALMEIMGGKIEYSYKEKEAILEVKEQSAEVTDALTST